MHQWGTGVGQDHSPERAENQEQNSCQREKVDGVLSPEAHAKVNRKRHGGEIPKHVQQRGSSQKIGAPISYCNKARRIIQRGR
jgi:hypothetical protein